MGEALPLNIAQQLKTPLTQAQPLPTLSIPTNVVALPDSLQSIARPVAVTGTIIDMLMSGELSLRTAMGTINLALTSIQNDMVSALFDLVSTPGGKAPTIELQLQAGSPPKQATLIIPKANAVRQADDVRPLPVKAIAPALVQPAQAHDATIKITVLPDGLDSKAIMAPKTGQKGQTAGHPAQDKAPDQPKSEAPTTAKPEPVKADAPAPDQAVKTEAPTQAAQQPARAILQNQNATAPARTLTAGQEAKVKIETALAPDAAWPSNLADSQIKATVIGKSANGHMLIRAEGKTLFVHDAVSYPAGTKLVLTVQPADQTNTLLLPLSPDRDFEPARALAQALQNIDPQAAQHFMAHHLPTPQHHFAGTALFLLSAFVGKNFEEWLGPQAVQTLERSGKQSLKDKLVDALKEATDSAATDARVGAWKAFPIPLHYAGAFEMLRLYVHRDAGESQQQNVAAAQVAKTRFVISVNLSRLGPIQLDGLSQKKQLDLVVRSERDLPDHLTINLRDAALKSLEAVGLKGTILFQSGRTGWVSIEDNKIKPAAVVT